MDHGWMDVWLVTTDAAAYAEHQYSNDQQKCKQANTKTNCQLEPIYKIDRQYKQHCTRNVLRPL